MTAELCPCGHPEAEHWQAVPGGTARPCAAEVEPAPGRYSRLCPCADWRPRRPAPAKLRIANVLARWLS